MTATLSGPSSGTIYKPTTNFTVAQSGLFTGSVTPSDGLPVGQAGIFTPQFLSWLATSQSQTFTYTPNKSGSIPISIVASVGSIAGSPVTLTVAVNSTTSVVFTGPTPGGNGYESAVQGTATGNFTVTPNGLLTDTIVPRDGRQGGTFTPSSLVFSNSATPQTFTYTPAKTGIYDITLFSLTGIVYPSIFKINSTPKAATTATLTGPTTARAGFGTNVPFTVSLDGYYSGVITPSDSSQGGTFSPPTLIYPNNSNAPQTFIYTPANTASGNKSISISASPSLSTSGSPITVAVSAATPWIGFAPGRYQLFYWPNPTNS